MPIIVNNSIIGSSIGHSNFVGSLSTGSSELASIEGNRLTFSGHNGQTINGAATLQFCPIDAEGNLLTQYTCNPGQNLKIVANIFNNADITRIKTVNGSLDIRGVGNNKKSINSISTTNGSVHMRDCSGVIKFLSTVNGRVKQQ